jgi:two-component system, sensor histidine kinase and response regulator
MNHEKSVSWEAHQPPLAKKDTILIVDDLPANTDVLVAALADTYSVSVTMDGQTALKSIADVEPDLILLDIMMPGMDGYEVCAKLKANPDTRDIPIIFLTALTGSFSAEKGLNLGAVDYITKPINPALVKARVRNHLALRRARVEAVRQRDQAEAAYQKLRKLEKLRDDLVHMIVHDMRSPLMSIGFFLEVLSPEEVNAPEFQKNLRDVRDVTKGLRDTVSTLLDVSRLEAAQMPLHREACDLGQLTSAVVEKMSGLVGNRHLSVDLPAQPLIAYCDPAITERIIQNLLGNAIKFTPDKGSVRVELVADEQYARLSITDTGCGIPSEYHEKVFEKFGQVEAKKEVRVLSSGLGLTFCKLAVEAHGGSIQLDSEVGRGSTFHVRLPLANRGAGTKNAAIEMSSSSVTKNQA